MRYRNRLISLIIAAGAVAGLMRHNAEAATSLGFAISPPSAEYAADPGHSVAGTIKIVNLTDQVLSLAVDKNNFVARGEEGQVDLTTEDNLYSLAPWFRVTGGAIIVPPRGVQQVQFNIDVPLAAEPGGRYGSLVFHTVPVSLPSGQSGAAIKQQLASLIFLRVNGAAREKLTIASFASDKSFYEYGPVLLSLRVKDEGNVHERPTGAITIKDMLGRKVAQLPLDEKNVIPGAIRRIDSNWSKRLLFGRFTASLNMKYANNRQLTAIASFLVIPYKLLGVILVFLVVAYVIIWRGRKRLARAYRVIMGQE